MTTFSIKEINYEIILISELLLWFVTDFVMKNEIFKVLTDQINSFQRISVVALGSTNFLCTNFNELLKSCLFVLAREVIQSRRNVMLILFWFCEG